LTPLHCAALNSHLNVVEYLVNQKADINSRDSNGETALARASDYSRSNVVDFLRNKGGTS